MNRPSFLHVGGILYWVIRTRNPDTQVLKDADSVPTVGVRKNGASVGDSVTITKRSATTGIYDCSYNPAGEVEGDKFTLEESATVTGTTTSSATYENSWDCTVIAVERGTDGANTTTPPTANQNRDATLNALLVDYTSTGTVGYVLNAFFAMIENVTGWRFTAKAVEQAPTGATVSVTPVVSQTPVRVVGSNIETFIGDLSDIRVGVFSGDDPVDLSGLGNLEICVQTKGGVDLDFVEMADITIDGDDSNYFSWTPSGESVSQVRSGAKWSLRKSSNKQVIAYGAWIVVDAALEDIGS